MPERKPFLSTRNTEELSILLAKRKELSDPVEKFFGNLSFIAGVPYAAVFVSVLVRMAAGEHVTAIETLSGAAPLLITKTYKRLHDKYTHLAEDEKLKIREKVSSPPIAPIMNVVSRVLDFPITKRAVTYRTRVPRGIDINQN